MSKITPGDWPGLGAESESMAGTPGHAAGQPARDREAMDTAARLTSAVEDVAGQLRAVYKQLEAINERQERAEAWRVKATRRGTVAIVMALALFLATGWAFWTLNSDRVAGCEASNQVRAEGQDLWAYLVRISPPPPHETPAARAARRELVTRFLSRVNRVYAPVQCRGIFG